MSFTFNPFTANLDAVSKENILNGTAQGQIAFWDATSGKWTYTETSELFWDDTNKRLGIGTTSPNRELEVKQGTDTSASGIRLTDTTTNTFDMYIAGGGNVRFEPRGGAGTVVVNGAMSFLDDKAFNFGNSNDYLFRYNSAGTKFQFNSGTEGEIFIVQDGTNDVNFISDIYVDGNVGIGTDSPEGLLHINDGVSYGFRNGIVFGDGDTGIYESSDDVLRFDFGGTTQMQLYSGYFRKPVKDYWAIRNDQVGSNIIPSYTWYQDEDTGIGHTDPNILHLITNGTTGLTVDASQNVGIGTDSPTAKLHIGAGTASKAPLKMTSGVLKTTPESGTIEYLSDYFYIRGGDGFKVGDSSNYTEIKDDGEINLHGTARVKKDLWIDSNGIKAPGSKPATFVEDGLTGCWEFADAIEANQEQVSGTIKIPSDMDRTVIPTFNIGWHADTVSPGNAKWQFEYLWAGVNEDVRAAAQETLTVITTASATAGGLIVTEVTGIDLPSATDKAMFWRITRLSADAQDTISEAIHMRGEFFRYTANSLGESI